MTEPKTFTIGDLRLAVDRALTLAEQELGSEMQLTEDYYWHLPVDAAFDMTRKPPAFTAGQLSDDLGSVDDPEQSVWWHDLGHLVGLLRYLEHRAMR